MDIPPPSSFFKINTSYRDAWDKGENSVIELCRGVGIDYKVIRSKANEII